MEGYGLNQAFNPGVTDPNQNSTSWVLRINGLCIEPIRPIFEFAVFEETTCKTPYFCFARDQACAVAIHGRVALRRATRPRLRALRAIWRMQALIRWP